MVNVVTAHTQASFDAPLDAVWIAFVPVDLCDLFKGRGPLPAVVKVSGQTGSWDVVGRNRSVTLSDGGQLVEEITSVTLPDGQVAVFDYVVRGYSGFIGMLTDEAEGHWEFSARGKKTDVSWTYQFRPRSSLTRPLLGLVIGFLWTGYMGDALKKMKTIAETQAQGT